ncbi:methyltransferase domain-containing protein [Altererythrobacter salegens]|uniref:Methyltransferase domain-containing protein n=1 Tax=Croceibacterium salegens TaxID=1737568 RepID=A0A6I4STI1_9SPHN|nr:cyclopropane-fatty-acyl-phospholipid synthase family protein [Croceibacterium salegens]MXO58688.1 methyltransferase domain-containing protein [Croceibacterium salegens]
MKREAARGGALLQGGRRFGIAPGFVARRLAGGFQSLLDRIDEGLVEGSILMRLPDGSVRMLGGREPGFAGEVTIHDWRALIRFAVGGSAGFYQAWEAGEWSSPDPVPLCALFSLNGEALGETGRAKGPYRVAARFAHWLNRNTRSGAEKNIQVHYDLGNDFYRQWLDPTMAYSSAYKVGNDGLEAAQHRKWERLAERVGSPQTVLEIGCGWGGLCNHFAQAGANVTGISLSDEQLAWARERFPKVEFLKQDYRDTSGQFDAIVSVEMVEALGRAYWPDFMDCLARNLKPGGRAAIQYIAMKDSLFEGYARNADFIQAYVFPGGLLIKASEFRALAEERGLSWQDQEDFPLDYAETLRIWRERFDLACREERLPAGFDDRFRNLWRFYLMYCEGGFRGGGITVSQVTLVKDK